MFLIGTNRMSGRPTASQIASASAASVLLLFTYGLTNCGAMSFTVCPNSISVRAQKGEPPQASIPMRHGTSSAKNAATCARFNGLRNRGFLCASTPWTLLLV